MSAFTEKAITDTFIKLLNKKPLDKITIKDLVDECGINRSTFYYYFDDIYDLLNHVLDMETKKALDNNFHESNWMDGLMNAISFATENKRAVYHIYNSVSRDELERYLYKTVGAVTEYAVNAAAMGLKVSNEDKAIVSNVYKYIFVGLVHEWLESDMRDDAKDILNRVYNMLEGNMRTMLERAAAAPSGAAASRR